MLLIKKIETQTDVEELLKIDPMAEEHIYVLGEENKKTCLWRMNPMHESELKSFFGLLKKSDATIWKGGYYVSARAFDLNFESSLNSVDTPRKLLTKLKVRVLGINFNEDLTELATFLGGKNELTAEEFDTLLAARKKTFFDELQRKLDNSDPTDQSIDQQIFDLALQAMTEFFPYLKIEITYSGTEEELTAEEKTFKENCRKLAQKQDEYYADIKTRQAESAYNLSLKDLEENERESDFAMKMRDEDRKLAIEEKKNIFRQSQYAAEKEREQNMLELQTLEKEQAQLQLEIAQINEQRKNIRETLEQKARMEAVELVIKEANAEAAQSNADAAKKQSEKADLEIELLKIQLEKEKLTLEKCRSTAEHRPVSSNYADDVRKLDNQMANLYNRSTASDIVKLVSDQSSYMPVELKKENLIPSVNMIDARGLKLAVPAERIKVGDQLKIVFKSPVAGYLTMICQESGGGNLVLTPNNLDPGQHTLIQAHVEYTLPSQVCPPLLVPGQVLEQTGPVGSERVLAIVSPTPLLNITPGEPLVYIPQQALDDLTARLQLINRNVWAAGCISYMVED